MAGTITRELDQLHHSILQDDDIRHRGTKRYDYHRDVRSFVKEFWKDKLFHRTAGRQHPSFPGFKAESTISQPAQLKDRLNKYTMLLDREKQCLM